MNWIEVALHVNGELAEAVAEVLARYIPAGIVIEKDLKKTRSSAKEPLIRVSGYIPLDAKTDHIRQKIREALWHLGRIQPLPEPVFKPLPDTNWIESWKSNYRPIPVGKRLMILPVWAENLDPDRIPLRIEPGMAFGTGTHPTTQLALDGLERWVRPGSGCIDMGCGSGILTIAARKLGALPVLGVDVDPDAIRAAEINATHNGSLEGVVWGSGSVREVRSGAFGLRSAPVVVANILTHILIEIIQQGLVELVDPGGVLILSGVLDETENNLLEAVAQQPITRLERHQQGDWVSLAYRTRSATGRFENS